MLGSTGSGKTSIINLLLRFYDYQEGSIRLDGVELSAYPRALLRRNIGIVEQQPFLFSRSIRENIAYGADREVSDAEVEAAAKAAAIRHHPHVPSRLQHSGRREGRHPVRWSTPAHRHSASASTKDPRILVLDDATSSVDTETEEQIQAALKEAWWAGPVS